MRAKQHANRLTNLWLRSDSACVIALQYAAGEVAALLTMFKSCL